MKLKELMKLREELKEVGRRIDIFTDEAKGMLDDVAIELNATSLLLSNIETNRSCNEIEKSCDKMCDTLDRIDKMEDTHDEDSREEWWTYN